MELNQIHKVHFIGVGGIGVSALIRFFAQRGSLIAGSDVTLPPRDTFPEGQYYEGHDAAHLAGDVSLVVYSPAVPEQNPERVRARELAIPAMSYPEALAMVTAPFTTIAVSGTHGKSTTTALMGKLFEGGGLDPSVIVGAEVPGWPDRNLRMGKSDIFIVEACEYRRNMLNLTPQAILLTNLELDHPDYYHDLADIKSAFREYIAKLSGEDLLIINNDDANIRDIVRDSDAIIVRFGVGEGADLYARAVSEAAGVQSFELVWKGTPQGVFSTPLAGLYSVYNILAAVATYLAYGGSSLEIQGVLNLFHGVGRRFEIVGTLANERTGAMVISDYAHHPTALRAVVAGALSRYKDKKVLTVFRPHHRERTEKLMNAFVETILGVPHIILVEIYDVAGREEGIAVSSQNVIEKVLMHNPRHDILYAKDLFDAETLIRQQASLFDVILVVGAGDADVLAQRLVSS